jgi:hypothetical protein
MSLSQTVGALVATIVGGDAGAAPGLERGRASPGASETTKRPATTIRVDTGDRRLRERPAIRDSVGAGDERLQGSGASDGHH